MLAESQRAFLAQAKHTRFLRVLCLGYENKHTAFKPQRGAKKQRIPKNNLRKSL